MYNYVVEDTENGRHTNPIYDPHRTFQALFFWPSHTSNLAKEYTQAFARMRQIITILNHPEHSRAAACARESFHFEAMPCFMMGAI